MLGLAFGESNVMDALADRLLYTIKDELMAPSDWWGGRSWRRRSRGRTASTPRRLTAV